LLDSQNEIGLLGLARHDEQSADKLIAVEDEAKAPPGFALGVAAGTVGSQDRPGLFGERIVEPGSRPGRPNEQARDQQESCELFHISPPEGTNARKRDKTSEPSPLNQDEMTARMDCVFRTPAACGLAMLPQNVIR
jgi:hypothetical protein